MRKNQVRNGNVEASRLDARNLEKMPITVKDNQFDFLKNRKTRMIDRRGMNQFFFWFDESIDNFWSESLQQCKKTWHSSFQNRVCLWLLPENWKKKPVLAKKKIDESLVFWWRFIFSIKWWSKNNDDWQKGCSKKSHFNCNWQKKEKDRRKSGRLFEN